MIVECDSCGAPLDTDGSTPFVKCKYCNLSNRIASLKTISAMTPPGWTPPAVWAPPQPLEPHRHVQISDPRVATAVAGGAAAATGATGCMGILIVGLIGVVLLATAGAIVFAMRTATPVRTAPASASWDGRTPLRCGGNERIELTGITASLPQQTAIEVSMNCEIVLSGCHITAAQGIDVRGNGQVVLRESTIVSSGNGIAARMNSHIELDRSTITAAGIGVEATGNSEVRMSGGRVSGSPRAVSTDQRATLEQRDGELIDLPAL